MSYYSPLVTFAASSTILISAALQTNYGDDLVQIDFGRYRSALWTSVVVSTSFLILNTFDLATMINRKTCMQFLNIWPTLVPVCLVLVPDSILLFFRSIPSVFMYSLLVCQMLFLSQSLLSEILHVQSSTFLLHLIANVSAYLICCFSRLYSKD